MRIPLDKFLWNKETRVLTAEISDLQVQSLPKLIEVYNDNTKQERKFHYMQTKKDAEQEIVSWDYYNSKDNIKLVIFND